VGSRRPSPATRLRFRPPLGQDRVVVTTTIGFIASAAMTLVAISFLQRERTKAREERRPQDGSARSGSP